MFSTFVGLGRFINCQRPGYRPFRFRSQPSSTIFRFHGFLPDDLGEKPIRKSAAQIIYVPLLYFK